MRSRSGYATLVIIPILFAFTADSTNCGGRTVSPDREFTLKRGETAVIPSAKLAIKFIYVQEDSRCPQGVTCVWAGSAKVELLLRANGTQPLTASLNTGVDPKQLDYHGYQVKLLGVTPHPKEGETIKPGDYRAVLIVSKRQ